MKRSAGIMIVIGLLVAISVGAAQPTRAADEPVFERSSLASVGTSPVDVLPTIDAVQAAAIGTLDAGQRVIVLGRNDDGSWLRIQSYLGYGYVTAKMIILSGDATKALANIPVVAGDLPTTILPTAAPPDDAQQEPILPTVTDYIKQIYQRGLKLGNLSDIFTKVGDCMTADLNLFLGRFGTGHYQLGQYQSLKDVITFYSKVSPRKGAANSFVMQSLATHKGFNASSVEDPEWTDTKSKLCKVGDTPLTCEYNLVKPGVAIIMFGTNDIDALSPVQFDFFLRLVISDTLNRGIIPLVTTFPGEPNQLDKANLINQIIVQAAHDYDVPLLNLWLALQPLPDHGRNPNSMYLSWLPTMSPSSFTGKNMDYGHTIHNLVTLQALDILWRGVIQG